MVKKDYNQLYDDLIRGIPEDMPAVFPAGRSVFTLRTELRLPTVTEIRE